MSRTVFCDGAFVDEHEARVSLFDRGLLFGDSVYEVTAVLYGGLVDNAPHLARLERSLRELDIPLPLPLVEIEAIQHELIARNALEEGTVYLQVSRGAADRDFLPPRDMRPAFFAFTQAKRLLDTPAHRQGVAVMLMDDPRWLRRDIKSTMLLGQVMAKREARACGFAEAWLVEHGLVTEGASCNAFIVTPEGSIVTRANSHAILPGCTRRAVLRLCAEHAIGFEERSFSPDEARTAAEAFLTSASSLVTPVVRIGETAIGAGSPGPVTRLLQRYYIEEVRLSTRPDHLPAAPDGVALAGGAAVVPPAPPSPATP